LVLDERRGGREQKEKEGGARRSESWRTAEEKIPKKWRGLPGATCEKKKGKRQKYEARTVAKKQGYGRGEGTVALVIDKGS